MIRSMITQVRLLRYKGFADFKLTLPSTAALIGPNGAGKTTLAQALRLTAAVLQYCQRRNATKSFIDETFESYPRSVVGYPLRDISARKVAWFKDENLRHEFRDESSGIEVTFKSKALLRIVWPTDTEAYFYVERLPGMPVRSAADVRACTPTVAVVPTLAPVELREEVLAATYIRENLGTRLTSRHFRNQLYRIHYLSERSLDEFVDYLLANTPEMTSLKLQDEYAGGAHLLDLYFTEATGRTDREVNWLGDGMQVWLQIVFHIWLNHAVDVLVLDEPDVYLHPDLQRRLIGILDDRGGQNVVATHAPEILTEIGRDAVVWIDRSRSRSRRARTDASLDQLNLRLGSGFNLGMARALRSRAVLFVEGDDMKVLRILAGRVGASRLNREQGLTVIPLGGFSNWHQVEPFAWLARDLLGDSVTIQVLLDSDYRTTESIHDLETALSALDVRAHVWRRKELESYLLVAEGLARAASIDLAVAQAMLMEEIERLRPVAQASFLARRQQSAAKKLAPGTVLGEALKAFEDAWSATDGPAALAPPKDVLAAMSGRMKAVGGTSFSPRSVARQILSAEVPTEMSDALLGIEHALDAVVPVGR